MDASLPSSSLPGFQRLVLLYSESQARNTSTMLPRWLTTIVPEQLFGLKTPWMNRSYTRCLISTTLFYILTKIRRLVSGICCLGPQDFRV